VRDLHHPDPRRVQLEDPADDRRLLIVNVAYDPEPRGTVLIIFKIPRLFLLSFAC
jgi:hypothetical protein